MRRRSTRLNGATAEALLDGHAPDTPVTWLLAAAAAPGRAEEIAGEAAARAAFAGARTTQAPFVRPPQARRSLASRLIAAKAVALVLLAAGATGGVALAATAQFAPAPGVAERPAPPPAAPLPLPAAPPSTSPTTPTLPPTVTPASSASTSSAATSSAASGRPPSGSSEPPASSRPKTPSSAPRQAVQRNALPRVSTTRQTPSCTATVPCGPSATRDSAPAPAAVPLAAEAAAPTTSTTTTDPQPIEQRSTANPTYHGEHCPTRRAPPSDAGPAALPEHGAGAGARTAPLGSPRPSGARHRMPPSGDSSSPHRAFSTGEQ